jgi:hypothetical protein
MVEKIKAEEAKLQILSNQIASGDNQLAQMREEFLRIQGGVRMLKGLLAAEEELAKNKGKKK